MTQNESEKCVTGPDAVVAVVDAVVAVVVTVVVTVETQWESGPGQYPDQYHGVPHRSAMSRHHPLPGYPLPHPLLMDWCTYPHAACLKGHGVFTRLLLNSNTSGGHSAGLTNILILVVL